VSKPKDEVSIQNNK
jgi:hypothetical protein